MTRTEANEVLSSWKAGVRHYSQAVIDLALFVTGDLVNLAPVKKWELA